MKSIPNSVQLLLLIFIFPLFIANAIYGLCKNGIGFLALLSLSVNLSCYIIVIIGFFQGRHTVNIAFHPPDKTSSKNNNINQPQQHEKENQAQANPSTGSPSKN